jgi:hypothetical protein
MKNTTAVAKSNGQIYFHIPVSDFRGKHDNHS